MNVFRPENPNQLPTTWLPVNISACHIALLSCADRLYRMARHGAVYSDERDDVLLASWVSEGETGLALQALYLHVQGLALPKTSVWISAELAFMLVGAAAQLQHWACSNSNYLTTKCLAFKI